MTVNEFLKKTRKGTLLSGYEWIGVRNRIICKDGFNVSVQASKTHYCSPRDNNGPYDAVELGFPSRTMGKAFNEYKDDSRSRQTDTVFAYVPVYLIEELLAKHGGIIGMLTYIKEEQ